MRRAHNAITHAPLNCFCPEKSLNRGDFDVTDTPCRKALQWTHTHTHTVSEYVCQVLYQLCYSNEAHTCIFHMHSTEKCQMTNPCDFPCFLYPKHAIVWLCWKTLDKNIQTQQPFRWERTVSSMQAAVTWDGFTLLRCKKNTHCERHCCQDGARSCKAAFSQCHRVRYLADLHCYGLCTS